MLMYVIMSLKDNTVPWCISALVVKLVLLKINMCIVGDVSMERG